MPDLQDNAESRLILRGNVYWIDFGDDAKIRPSVIVSNDVNNHYADEVIAVPASTHGRNDLPTHVTMTINGNDGIVRCENVTKIPKDRIHGFIERLCPDELRKIDAALKCALWL